jgi:hypothetical protein
MEWFLAIIYVAAIGLPLVSAIAKVVAEIKYPYWSRDWWRLTSWGVRALFADIPFWFVAVCAADSRRQVLVVSACLAVAVMAMCWRALLELAGKLVFFFASKTYVASVKARRATTRVRRLSDTVD